MSHREWRAINGAIKASLLRRKAVCLFIELYIVKGIEACDAAERRTPCDAAERRTALRKFQGPFQSVRMYWEKKALHEIDDAGNEWRQALPVWCSSKLHKLLREIMEGERDSLFAQACSQTVGGGIAALTFSGDWCAWTNGRAKSQRWMPNSRSGMMTFPVLGTGASVSTWMPATLRYMEARPRVQAILEQSSGTKFIQRWLN